MVFKKKGNNIFQKRKKGPGKRVARPKSGTILKYVAKETYKINQQGINEVVDYSSK